MNRLQVRLKAHPDNDGYDYLVVEVRVDNEPIADFTSIATDLAVLLRSIAESGEHFILTCWCGNAECVGIRRGVTVRHERNKVYWSLIDPGPQRQFVFDHQEYEQAIRASIAQGKRLIAHLQTAEKRKLTITPERNLQWFDASPSRNV
jgi:hypothetical protein